MKQMTVTEKRWVAVVVAILITIWVSIFITVNKPSTYQRETQRFATELIKYEESCEHIQNLTMKNQIAYGSYAQGLRLMTREHLRRMGALRILQSGTDDYGKVSP